MTSYGEIFEIGSLPLIHGRITTLPVNRTSKGPRRGLFKATCSLNGKHPNGAPFFGSMGNVSCLPVLIRPERLMFFRLPSGRRKECSLVRLSSVLFQLCDQSDSYHDILSTFYSTHRDGAQIPSDNELTRCLKDLLELPGQAPVYVIIDALDECPDTSALSSPREKVLQLLEDLIHSKIPNLRICVTSRPEADIKLVLGPLTFRSISIHDESGQMHDIENYIKWTVNSNRKMRRWKEEHKQLVIDVLTKRADGM